MSAFCEHVTEGRWRCRFPLGHDGEHGQHINVMRSTLAQWKGAFDRDPVMRVIADGLPLMSDPDIFADGAA